MEHMTGRELIKTILRYDFGDTSLLSPILYMVENHIRKDTYISGYSVIPFENNPMSIKSFLGDQLFEALVLLYGDYGMSPRSGWISDLKGFEKLILELIKDTSEN